MQGGGQTDEKGPFIIRQRGSPDALVERIAASPAFQKSKRLRELLLFLCSRALSDPDLVLHEQDIGVEVFGRRAAYDTTQDTIVRVHVSQLRKKLQQYFETDGRDETTIVEIPRGAYTPVFTARPPESPATPAAEPRDPPRSNRPTWILGVLAASGFALAGWLAFRPGNAPRPVVEARPTVERLWRQLSANGRPTCVVLSDGNIALFQDAIRHQLTLNEYRNKEFARLADELIPAGIRREHARMLFPFYFTHVSDAHLAGVFSVLNASHQVPTDIVFARDFGVGYLQSHNVILLGSRRTNPWVDLFEAQLNFRTTSTEQPLRAYFENSSPLPGESPAYEVQWAIRGYCRLAYLPNPARNGTILLISGTDMQATAAGGQFVSSERWVQHLRSRLRLSGDAPFPFFELLLRVDYMATNTPRFEVIAHRLPKL